MRELNNSKIKKAEEYLKSKFEESEYFKVNEEQKNYRIEHSYRVANIGKEIAIKEGFDVDIMVIGCLLHDISYCNEFKNQDDWINHGRASARIVRSFLKEIQLEDKVIEDICYGLAIHVDDKADFDGERTAFAATIGDADNIDRFDVYRIYENLQYSNFHKMNLDEKLEKIIDILDKLNKYKEVKLETKTATELWNSKLDFQIEFFSCLKDQLENSNYIK